jgi:chromosome segregation ATPase
MVCVTAYQGFSAQVKELRHDLGHLSEDLRKDMVRLAEAQADLVKKDQFANTMRAIWDGIKELRSNQTELTALKERCAGLAEACRAGEEQRRQLADEVQRLRERRAAQAERVELVEELQRLRERLAQMEGRQSTAANAGPGPHRAE